ncbi:tetratricopeptide repeat protein, partial [Streptomyces sp. NPDC056517]|uniref:tetratricopeptide repeat protein n=1 Tax=Streptomyces sp. NPDC056517 TaxID=3345848 RepID=UPI003678FE81
MLGGRLVLTAAHVLKDPSRVSVQLPDRAGVVKCRVMWQQLDDGPQGWDAALLLAEGELSDRPLPGVRWGRLVTMQSCPARAFGFPEVGKAGGDAVSLVQRDGRVLPVSGRDRDRYVLAGASGAAPVEGVSPWGGMSGAALWCGSGPGMLPLLTGVVVGDAPGWSHTQLEAMPAYALASNPVVRRLVEEHTGRPMSLEPADLQDVTDRLATPRPPRSPADLLRPEQAVVSFMGRDDLLKELSHWCEPAPETAASSPPDAAGEGIWGWGESPVRARLLTGQGGAGKTRLSGELAARMTVRGWTTIRLTTDTTVPLDILSQVGRPLLIVVDYAETRTPQLHALLEAVDHDQADSPVRVLALARAAGDWWTRAAQHPHSQALAAAAVTPVTALHPAVDDRATAYQQAVGDFSTRLHLLSPTVDWSALLPAVLAPAARPPLDGSEFDTPLSVQMAALLALLDATGIPQPTNQANSLEGRLLGHERGYWDKTASSREALCGERTGTQTRALAVALACMVPATDRDDARALLAHLPGLGDDSAAAVRSELATWLTDLYPAPAEAEWGSLQPDWIAEHQLGTEAARERSLFTRILTELPDPQAAQALTVLARTSQHPQYNGVISHILREAVGTAPEVLGPAALTTATRTAHPAPLIAALTELTRTTSDVALLCDLSSRIPHATLALSEWAADLATALVEHYDSHNPDLPGLAASLNNQSVRLTGLGRREEALIAVTRAVEIRETLADRRPDAFLPDLAMSLNNQSNRLSDLGRREEALTAITRAVDTYQTLADRRPDAFLPDLAASLNNQSACLADLGRREEALTAITRAVDTYQTLADRRPDAFLPGLAASLNNQSVRLTGLGRREEALTAVTRALEIRETLADRRPDAFLPDLAASLNNQSNHLSDLGRREEALTAITRAVDTYQTLADRRPDAFLPDLAMSLNNQSNRLSDLGRRE